VNGIKLLLDTNFIIGLIKRTEPVIKILAASSIALDECAYSFITRIELLSYPAITQPEIESIESILATMHYVSTSKEIENTTIRLRRQYRLKTPDAIVAATAIALNLELLTLDQQLAKQMQAILVQENNP